MINNECTHTWKTCPVHNPSGKLPPMSTVITCLYGGLMTKNGTPWDEEDSKAVVKRVFEKVMK